jgi:hypothetical protein
VAGSTSTPQPHAASGEGNAALPNASVPTNRRGPKKRIKCRYFGTKNGERESSICFVMSPFIHSGLVLRAGL